MSYEISHQHMPALYLSADAVAAARRRVVRCATSGGWTAEVDDVLDLLGLAEVPA